RQLLLDDRLWVSPRMAEFYGLEPPESWEDGFVPLQPQGEPRAGVLTHPYMMAALSHHRASSPLHRGVFIVRSILGRALRNPPEAIEILPAESHPDLTTRQRVELQTKSASCQACHAVIN